MIFTYNYDLSITFAVTALLALATTWSQVQRQGGDPASSLQGPLGVQGASSVQGGARTAGFSMAFLFSRQFSARLLWSAGSIALLALAVMIRIVNQRNTTVAVRNFYGACG